MAGTDRDDEGFPPCGPDNELDTYTDEFEVTGRSDVQSGLWTAGRTDPAPDLGSVACPRAS